MSHLITSTEGSLSTSAKEIPLFLPDMTISVDLRDEVRKCVIKSTAVIVAVGAFFCAVMYLVPLTALILVPISGYLIYRNQLTLKTAAIFFQVIFRIGTTDNIAFGMFKIPQESIRHTIGKIWSKKQEELPIELSSHLQLLVTKVDQKLVDPITKFFPKIPTTIRGQVYETSSLLSWIQQHPDGNNSPLENGHIAATDIHFDPAYYLRLLREVNDLKTSPKDWMTSDFIKWMDGQASRHKEIRQTIAARIALIIIRAFVREQIDDRTRKMLEPILLRSLEEVSID